MPLDDLGAEVVRRGVIVVHSAFSGKGTLAVSCEACRADGGGFLASGGSIRLTLGPLGFAPARKKIARYEKGANYRWRRLCGPACVRELGPAWLRSHIG